MDMVCIIRYGSNVEDWLFEVVENCDDWIEL